jgi:Spy/CpxP family protein refolding chaperone
MIGKRQVNQEEQRTMRKIFGQAMLVAVVVVGLAAAIGAQPPAGGGRGQGGMRQGMGPGGGPMAMLNLSADQQAAVKAIQEKHRAANQPTGDAMRGLREQLHTALFADSPDKAQIMELASQIAKAEAGLLPARIEMQLEMIAVLNPEQKKIAKEHNLFGDGMRGGPMGPGGPRGGRGGQGPVQK